MSQPESSIVEAANGSLKQLSSKWWFLPIWITLVILELIRARKHDLLEVSYLLDVELPRSSGSLDDVQQMSEARDFGRR